MWLNMTCREMPKPGTKYSCWDDMVNPSRRMLIWNVGGNFLFCFLAMGEKQESRLSREMGVGMANNAEKARGKGSSCSSTQRVW